LENIKPNPLLSFKKKREKEEEKKPLVSSLVSYNSLIPRQVPLSEGFSVSGDFEEIDMY
jgi:hypothetical protein